MRLGGPGNQAIVLVGEWHTASRYFKTSPRRIKSALSFAIYQEAQIAYNAVIHGFRTGGPVGAKWKPITPWTLATRRATGARGSRRARLKTRATIRAIKVRRVGRFVAYVGILDKKIADVARIHELGAGPFKIQKTPAMLRRLFWIASHGNLPAKRRAKKSKTEGKAYITVTIPARPAFQPVLDAMRPGFADRIRRVVAGYLDPHAPERPILPGKTTVK